MTFSLRRPAARVVLLDREGRIFLISAEDPIDPYKPDWLEIPGGGMGWNEDSGAAALRELGEETSIPADAVEILAETRDWIPYDLPHDLVPRLWKGRFRGQKQKWFLMRFSGDDALINIETDDPEFSHWAWMETAVLIDKIVPFKRDTYTRVFDEFAKVLADA